MDVCIKDRHHVQSDDCITVLARQVQQSFVGSLTVSDGDMHEVTSECVVCTHRNVEDDSVESSDEEDRGSNDHLERGCVVIRFGCICEEITVFRQSIGYTLIGVSRITVVCLCVCILCAIVLG